MNDLRRVNKLDTLCIKKYHVINIDENIKWRIGSGKS